MEEKEEGRGRGGGGGRKIEEGIVGGKKKEGKSMKRKWEAKGEA